MKNAIYKYSEPKNEPVLQYGPTSSERPKLVSAMQQMESEVHDIPLIIGGKEIFTGNTGKITMPHDHRNPLGQFHLARPEDVKMAIAAAMEAEKIWASFTWDERASINLRIAELVATKYRFLMNASTMLGQSKNAYQAEIDSACETIDFLRFNTHFISNIYHEQPLSVPGIVNKLDYRPLEGFVFAVSPFNFTAIASNLSMTPILMGNSVVWKPATTSILSNYYLMKVYQEAGLPDGVINFIPGSGPIIGNEIFSHRNFAGIHFTGSTQTFNNMWKTIANNLANYRSYPKIVGETGGKDFVFVHPSSDALEVATALVRGAFEYQGQKCSAASRAYVPKSLWNQVKNYMGDMLAEIKMGDVRDFSNFVNAVIDEKSFDNIMGYINHAKSSSEAEVVFGGTGDKSVGYFIQPTVIVASNPHYKSMEEEIFGPVLSIFVYEDSQFEETLRICDETSPYALTGAIFSRDRSALIKASDILRYAAGNLYYNDKPTGAVVGQQPFGGARSSGTNDKSGSYLNLLRWVSPRTIKETLETPTDYKYPFMK